MGASISDVNSTHIARKSNGCLLMHGPKPFRKGPTTTLNVLKSTRDEKKSKL